MKTVLAPNAPWYETVKPKVVQVKPKKVKRKRARPHQIDENFRKWLIKERYVNDRIQRL